MDLTQLEKTDSWGKGFPSTYKDYIDHNSKRFGILNNLVSPNI